MNAKINENMHITWNGSQVTREKFEEVWNCNISARNANKQK